LGHHPTKQGDLTQGRGTECPGSGHRVRSAPEEERIMTKITNGGDR
jgi:hypothetical protein